MDFEAASSTVKAVELSGQEVGDRALKIEAAAPPAAATPKKGNWIKPPQGPGISLRI